MINQPWKNKNWYTVYISKSFKNFKNKGYRYLTNNEKTFNLSDVKQWNMYRSEKIPSDNVWTRSGITHTPAVCEVYLSDNLVVRLVQGKVPTSEKTDASSGMSSNDKLIDRIVQVDQITPFFNSMQNAKLL